MVNDSGRSTPTASNSTSNSTSNSPQTNTNSNRGACVPSQSGSGPLHPNTAALPDYTTSLDPLLDCSPVSPNTSRDSSSRDAISNVSGDPLSEVSGDIPHCFVLPIRKEDPNVRKLMTQVLSYRMECYNTRDKAADVTTKRQGEKGTHQSTSSAQEKVIQYESLRAAANSLQQQTSLAKTVADRAAAVAQMSHAKLRLAQQELDMQNRRMDAMMKERIRKEVKEDDQEDEMQRVALLHKAERAEETLSRMEEQWQREDKEREIVERVRVQKQVKRENQRLRKEREEEERMLEEVEDVCDKIQQLKENDEKSGSGRPIKRKACDGDSTSTGTNTNANANGQSNDMDRKRARRKVAERRSSSETLTASMDRSHKELNGSNKNKVQVNPAISRWAVSSLR